MERKGYNFVIAICMLFGVWLNLYVGRVQAAVTLPPEDKPLKRHFYKKLKTCANVEAFVTHQVKLWWDKDKSITAKLLKLLYADCMVNGCDGSILLDGPHTEKNAAKNSRLDGFVLIDKIKKVVESRCPEVVSCSDILMLAVRDAVHLAGAPSYPVFLGRRDGLESKAEWVDLPSASISWEEGYAYFKSKGLDEQDYATLLGAHTLGKTHCKNIHDRLYDFNKTQKPDPTMSRLLLGKLRKLCPSSLKKCKDSTVFLTDKDGDAYPFTITYYSNVLSYDSVLGVDQQLLFNYNTSQLVLEYAEKFESFRREFTLSISRMGGLGVLTGNQGEIRKNCRLTNKNNPEIN
ncbi:putative peroxidase 61-like [Dorcoceras hygrometricum]|uniref:Peroxidase n=1 Tax=Dorcoceras hygrometricum TaxID=472368 RepID=A0A2Z7CUW6_9LAMI|nr:putative peroxidase 61-like [Dorcoceras hygrometricum]